MAETDPIAMGRATLRNLKTVFATSSSMTKELAKLKTKKMTMAPIRPMVLKPICRADTSVTCFFIVDSSIVFGYFETSYEYFLFRQSMASKIVFVFKTDRCLKTEAGICLMKSLVQGFNPL
jgi:hypothetical protein